MNELTIIPDGLGEVALSANGMEMGTVAHVAAFATLLGNAGMLPKGVSPQGAVVAILAGRNLGLDPFQAVQGIASINGRPAIWGDAMLAVVKASGLLEDERVEWLPSHKDCLGVRYTVKRKGVATPYVGEFSKAMAERAGLWGKSGPWSQYPDRMMLARARAYALRDGFADILRGMQCAEEMRDVVEVEPLPSSAPRRKRAPAAELLAPPEEMPAAEKAEATPKAEAANPTPPAPPPAQPAKPPKGESFADFLD